MMTLGKLHHLTLSALLVSLLLGAGCLKATVTVPSVAGLAQAAAQTAITNAGLVVGAITQDFSTTVPAGVVISQSPDSGSSVSSGSAVALTVSSGPQPVGVPNVTGLAQAAGTVSLAAVHLSVGTVTGACSNIVASGLIISQNPAVGTLMAFGSAVDLVVSTGPCNDSVPAVIGLTQAAASAALNAAGLAVGTVTQAYSSSVAAGLVISQTPNPGTSVVHGSAVALTVSKGPAPVTVPDVAGQTQAAASATLTAAGLSVGTVTQTYSATVPEGIVISQSPPSGSSVPPGSAVALTISMGPQPVVVPDVVGISQAAASTTITNALLALGAVARMYSGSAPSGEVISQNPVGGTSVLPGTAVSLDVSLGPEPAAGTVETFFLPGNVQLDMVWIPSGSLLMGSAETEPGRDPDEGPQHTVAVAGFPMGKYTVTKRQWQAVTGTVPWDGYANVGTEPDSPSVYFSWDDTRSFLTALNNCTGRSFRLPTEAEWEYACRGGTTTRFYWGDDPNYSDLWLYAWYAGNTATETWAHRVGSAGVTGHPNAFGLFDMSGNIWEMCEDDFHWNYDGAPAQGEAWVDSPRAAYRVLRGGSWYDSGSYLRSANRDLTATNFANFNQGIRVALSVSPVAVTSFAVNAGASPTPFRTVLLNNTCAGNPVECLASEVPDFSDATWQPWSAAPAFALSPGDGVKTVWFKARNASSESAAISATITLSTDGANTQTVVLPGGVPLELVRIPAGTFTMGSPNAEQDRYADEGPQHTVTLDAFWMGRYKLTQAQWTAVAGSNPSRFIGDPRRPVEGVAWNAAQIFIAALNDHITNTAQGPATFRLPSEAQWEYACRAGTTTRFYWGNDPGYTDIARFAWFGGNSNNTIHPVGLLLPNGWGLYDMSGNVWEWCQDWYHANYTNAPTDGSAWETPTASDRVFRGGGWFGYGGDVCRSAFRNVNIPPSGTDGYFGLRLVR